MIKSDYRGIIKVLLHNHSNQPYTTSPKQAIAQILFLPLVVAQVVEALEVSTTERGPQGFGSTNAKTFPSEVIELQPVAGRPPGTTFLGVQASKAMVRLNSPNGSLAQGVINSGSNISLVSTQLFKKIIKIEAYIVKDMNAPIILGNDFTDQYSLSIMREDGTTSLKLGTSGQTIPLDSSVNSTYLEVQAMQLQAAKVQH